MKKLEDMNLMDDFLVSSLMNSREYGEKAVRYILGCILKRCLCQPKIRLFFASTFWTKLQNIFGHYCKSKLDKVAKPRLAAILPAA